MSFVIRITFLFIGVVLFEDIACTSHEQQEKWMKPTPKDPVLPSLPILPGTRGTWLAVATTPTPMTSESNLIGNMMETFSSYFIPDTSTKITSVDPEEPYPTTTTITTTAEKITPEITTTKVTPEITTSSASDTVTPENTPQTSTTSISTTPRVPTTATPETSTMDYSTTTTTTPADASTTTEVEPELKCPGNQSRISERDLEHLVEIQIGHLKIVQLLNDSFFADAVSTRDIVKEDVQEFLAWLEGRPLHLKHILADLTKKRNDLDKVVSKKAVELQEYEVLEKEYKGKVQKLESVNKKIEKAKKFCELNCEVDVMGLGLQSPNDNSYHPENGESVELVPRYEKGAKYYCSHIDVLYRRIDNLLLHYLNNSQEEFNIKIMNDTKMYKAKVENFKEELKSIALSQFGKTMYNVFNLQDQYHHFSELVDIDLTDHLHKIKQELIRFQSVIMKLEMDAGKLRKYCTTCNMLRRRSHHSSFNSFSEAENKEDDLVEIVTLKGYNRYEERALADYQNIFNELQKLLREQGSQEDKIAKLKPLQEEIEKMTAEETKEFNKLKETIPKNSFDKVADLKENSIELNKKVDTLTKELAEKYNIQ